MKNLARTVENHHFNRQSAWYAPLVWTLWWLYGWVSFTGQASGTLIKGVQDSSPTKNKLQNLWLKFFGWKQGAYFQVAPEQAEAGYYVGYIPQLCVTATSVSLRKCHERKFMLKIGREDCRFFAVDLQGKEIPVRYIGTFPVADNIIHQAQSF